MEKLKTLKDFNLSEKIRKYNFPNDEDYLNVNWVKEFIKLLKLEGGKCLTNADWRATIDKLAGRQLVDET